MKLQLQPNPVLKIAATGTLVLGVFVTFVLGLAVTWALCYGVAVGDFAIEASRRFLSCLFAEGALLLFGGLLLLIDKLERAALVSALLGHAVFLAVAAKIAFSPLRSLREGEPVSWFFFCFGLFSAACALPMAFNGCRRFWHRCL
jgi:hypothetical protein